MNIRCFEQVDDLEGAKKAGNSLDTPLWLRVGD